MPSTINEETLSECTKRALFDAVRPTFLITRCGALEMKPFDRNASRAICFAAGIALSAAAICASEAPGFIRAVATVGAQTELPLERVASEGALADDTTHRSVAPYRQAASDQHTAMHLDASKLTPLHSGSRLRLRRDPPGYRRTITDSKYWT